MKKKALHIIILLLFIIFYVVVRKPYYSTQLKGEEGDFADIFINQPPGPNYLQIGRVNGREIYTIPQHPALSYETIALAGRAAETVINFSELSEYKTTVLLRALFSGFQLLVWVLIWYAIVVFDYFQNKTYLFFMIGLLSLSPIALESSLHLQVDNSVGALFVGFFCFSLLAFVFMKNKTAKYLILFISAALIGFGRNEWGIILFVSLLASIIFAKLFVIKFQTESIILILAGLAAGTVINIIFDNFNYFAGLRLITTTLKVDAAGSTLNPHIFMQSWVQKNMEKLPYLSTIVILLFVNIIKATRQFKKLFFEQVILLFFSLLLYFAFSATNRAGSSRYFVPAFFASIFTYILLTPNQKKTSVQIIFLYTILFIMIYFKPPIEPYKQIDVDPNDGCLMDIGAARGFFNEEVDYVTWSLGIVGQENFAEEYGVELCE